jgi:glycolate oxidase FAD binding subunit
VSTFIRPVTEWELRSVLSDARRRGATIEVTGAGTKRGVGRPIKADTTLSTLSMRGVSLYEPTELVMSARAGATVIDIERELDQNNQMLPFEPIDLGPALGSPARAGTIGGVFMTNLSGSRRIAAGSARDHLLGLKGVTGNGEVFKSGGRVMKNVTGYDMARGLTGSWGTLAVATELTFKVLPRPEETSTLVIFGLTDPIAVEVLSLALGTPYEVSGAMHIADPLIPRLRLASLRAIGKSITALRLETFSRFLPARIEKLRSVLKPYGDVHVLPDQPSNELWSELRGLSVFVGHRDPLWRISVPPKHGAAVVEGIKRSMAVKAFYDWAGGLLWLEVPDSAEAGATDIRRVIARTGGHATLIRASEAVRSSIDVFQPLDAALDRISRQIKAVFDNAGILAPGRMTTLP